MTTRRKKCSKCDKCNMSKHTKNPENFFSLHQFKRATSLIRDANRVYKMAS